MSLAEQWRDIERELPEGWGEARLALMVEDDAWRNRAAALLGPLAPGRTGKQLRFSARPATEAVRRAVRRLDRAGVRGELELLAATPAEALPAPERATLARAWQAALDALPSDWSDVYAQVELFSTDQLERAALLMAPLNPARYGGEVGFRFRIAREYGYGASPTMVRRCLERLDEAGIRGRLEVLRALSDTRPVATQGPVWRVGGRSV